jgi:hypothetical protein
LAPYYKALAWRAIEQGEERAGAEMRGADGMVSWIKLSEGSEQGQKGRERVYDEREIKAAEE